MPDITVSELKQRLDQGEQLNVIDVRELHEWQAGHLDAAKHIPLGTVPQAVSEGDLDDWKGQEVIMVCRAGGRSASAAQFLRQQGFLNVRNLTGGMTAWKTEIDPGFVVG